VEGEREIPIRRVLVALDASPSSLIALNAAADLAVALGIELSGLFVEDVNLLRIADLPFARALGTFSGRPQPLERRRLERELRMEASRARNALAAVAERELLRWSFQVARGMVTPEILAAVSDASLIVLGRAGWSGSYLGSTARAVAVSAPSSTLIVGREAGPSSTIIVRYDGSPVSEWALALAASLARKRQITVLIPTDASQDTRALVDGAKQRLVDRGISANYLEYHADDMSALVQVVNREDAGLLLLPGDSSATQDVALVALVEEIGCAILLVR
jgi:nucleotide-binding universal stress UspA family protein